MDLLIQVSSEGLAARLLSYFHEPLVREKVFGSKSLKVIAKDARLLNTTLPLLSLSGLSCNDPISEEGALTWFQSCELVRRNCVRCYLLPSSDDDQGIRPPCFVACSQVRLLNLPFISGRQELVSDIVRNLEEVLTSLGDIRIRLSCCPKQLEHFLVESLPPELDISPRDYTHALMVVEEQGEGARFRWSLVKKEMLYLQASDEPSTHPDTVAQAVNKIEEALMIARAIYPSLDQDQGGIHAAIDLGAAPGAWSGHLADKGVALVIAVDPAELNQRILDKKGVVHLKCRSEAAGERIVPLLASQEQGGGKADLLVSDMNVHPSEAAVLVLTLLPYVREGGLVIFTLKYHGKGQTQGKRDEAERQLNLAFGQFIENGRVFTLLANTTFEQTYIGRVIGKSVTE
jgi:hypothetical protein